MGHLGLSACLFLSVLPMVSAAQTLKTLRFPSAEMHGASDRKIHVWLPKGYSPKTRYPAIFTFAGGDDELTARVANYYAESLHELPPVIVVGVEAEVDEIGFSYETGSVNEAGKRFAAFWSGQMMPQLEKTYPLADFRIYLGHSYGANYADYLLREHPSWFHGYALIAPEKPEYSPDYGAWISHAPHLLSYYVASAERDLERRQAHARAIAAGFEAAKVGSVHFRYDSIPLADHRTSVPQALPAALEFLFAGYKDFDYQASDGDLSRWFETLSDRLRALYGVGIRRDSLNAAYFTGLAVEHKDRSALDAFGRYFMTEDADASVFFNTAQQHYALGDDGNAETLYRKAIARARKTGQPDFLLMSYRALALRLYSDRQHDAGQAWKTLEEGFRVTGDVAFKYFFGMVSARHGYRVDEGIRFLQEFARERDRSSFGTLYKPDGIDALLARCFLRQGDRVQAALFAERSLREDPTNEEAAAVKRELGP